MHRRNERRRARPSSPHPRGRPARRLPERARDDRDRRQDPADQRTRPRRLQADRGRQLRAPRRDPAALRRRRGAARHRRTRVVARMVLVPNSRGLDNALRVRDASTRRRSSSAPRETHNQRNINRDRRRDHGRRRGDGETDPRRGPHLRAVIATSFGCPFEGKVPMDRVLDLAEQFAESGATEIGFGDTTGMCNPATPASSSPPRSNACPGSRSPRTSTTPAARAWPTRTPRWRRDARASSPASASWAAARCRPARPATSPPRTSSACSTRWASSTGV